MRVQYVCADPGIPVFGSKGASVHVQEVVRGLRRHGAEVELFAARTGGAPPADLVGTTVHQLPCSRDPDPAARERACLAADRQVADRLAAAGPADVVYERYSLWSRAGMAHARKSGAAGILEVNAPLIDEQARHRELVHRRAAEAVVRDAVAAATAVVAVSEPVARWVRARTSQPDRVHVVANGADTERFRPPDVPAPGPFTVGFVGSLKPWHGVEVVVDALALAGGDCRLLLVGDGPEAAAVRAQVARLGLTGRVELTGAVPAEAVPAQLWRMHAAVAPYPAAGHDYFSPLKLFEYMGAGLPVVASRTGQAVDVITHRSDGLLVTPGDAAALAAALSELARDRSLRRHLGRNARATAVARHSWDRVVARSLALAGTAAVA